MEPISVVTSALDKALQEKEETSLLGWFDPTEQPLSWGSTRVPDSAAPPPQAGDATTIESVLALIPSEFGAMPPPIGVSWTASFDGKRALGWIRSYLNETRPYCELLCRSNQYSDRPILNGKSWRQD